MTETQTSSTHVAGVQNQNPSSTSAVERIVHVVQVPAPSTPSLFTPWNVFVIISVILFFAYLYFTYTSSLVPKLDEKESPFVTDVTSSEVSASVLNGDGTTKVVLMHATWCEHCRIMMPAFNAAAESTRQVRWLKVEQTNAGPILKSRTDIRGFPTIFGVRANGEVVQYGEREPRTEESLRKWALSLLLDSSRRDETAPITHNVNSAAPVHAPSVSVHAETDVQPQLNTYIQMPLTEASLQPAPQKESEGESENGTITVKEIASLGAADDSSL